MLSVTHTIAGLYAEHGGPSRSVPALCDALSGHVRVTVVTGAPEARRGSLRLPEQAQAIVVPEPAMCGRLLGVGALGKALRQNLKESGSMLVHDHGMWLPSNYMAARVAGSLRIPRVVSPRGMLSAWALGYKGLRKKLAWGLYQRRVLELAVAFHATAEKEAEEIRAAGFRQPIAVIRNGVGPPSVPEAAGRWTNTPRKALFLSRLHQKKGVTDLVEAWAAVRPEGWRLSIVGPDEQGLGAALRRRVAELGIGGAVHFAPEADEAERDRLMQGAALFILPSYDENYGIVVAEALASGLPVITTTATPWSQLKECGAGWVCAPGVQGLVEVLREACGQGPEPLRAMGQRGRAWIENSMSWERVAREMLEFYEWVLGRLSRRPEWVHA